MHFKETWSDIGRPFQGSICYADEVTYGTVGTVPQSVASIVKAARIETNEVNAFYRGISSPSVSVVTQKNVDYTLHLEYNPHHNDTLLDKLVDRTSAGTARSLSFDLGANTNSATTSSYYRCLGCKCKSVTISGSEGEPWMVAADFSVKSIATSTATSLLLPANPNDYVCMFNIAGLIQSGGVDLAYVTSSFDCTINHNLQDVYTVGSRTKAAAIECANDVTGSCDISLHEGGAVQFGDVLDAARASSVIIQLAHTGSGAPKLTLYDFRWMSMGVDCSDVNEGMMESIPYIAKYASLTTC